MEVQAVIWLTEHYAGGGWGGEGRGAVCERECERECDCECECGECV